MTKRKITESQHKKICRMYRQGLKGPAISKELGIPAPTIFDHLRSEGLTSCPRRTEQDTLEIKAMHFRQGMSTSEISQKIGRGKQFVRDAIKEGSERYRPVIPEVEIEETIRLWEECHNASAVGEKLGITSGAVLGRLRRRGIDIPPFHKHYDKGLPEDELYDRAKTMADLYQSGESIRKIAKQFKIPEETVSSWLHKIGVSTEKNKITEDKYVAALKMYRSGKSSKAAAAKIGVHESTLRNAMRKHGDPIRSREISEKTKKKYAKDYEDGYSPQDIALRHGGCDVSVRRILRDLGYKLRSGSEAAVLRSSNKPQGPHQGKSHYYRSIKTGKLEYAQSTYELARMIDLDNDPNVECWTVFHMAISYKFDGNTHHYNPDFLVRLYNGDLVVEEIKPQGLTKSKILQKKSTAAVNFFRKHGIDYRIITEQDLASELPNGTHIGGKQRVQHLIEKYEKKFSKEEIADANNAKYRLRREFNRRIKSMHYRDAIIAWLLPDTWRHKK